jgi:hypothetical protein
MRALRFLWGPPDVKDRSFRTLQVQRRKRLQRIFRGHRLPLGPYGQEIHLRFQGKRVSPTESSCRFPLIVLPSAKSNIVPHQNVNATRTTVESAIFRNAQFISSDLSQGSNNVKCSSKLARAEFCRGTGRDRKSSTEFAVKKSVL